MINAISIVCSKAGIGWFVMIIALTTLMFRVGSVNAWLLSPIVMFIDSSKDVMPAWFTKIEDKHGAPANALIIQAALVSFLTLMAYSMPSVEGAYWLIAAMATILYFIPFMAMFVSFIVLRVKHPDQKRLYRVPAGIPIAVVGFLVVLASTVLACLPPTGVDIGVVMQYEAKLLGGAIAFILIGYGFYAFHMSKQAKLAPSGK